ncbi:glycoside hydrolase family 108 protein [Rahnella variigena]|uniref:glycoside hydrolase family 108 protein n=1 Tax=Rahnella TaxID=34037 RepID=UPI000DD37CF7|nr:MULTISPECIES: glycosyl hydrolase 108 family protein [Rahnella]MDH2898319.1 glycoside hydrolase family 108 protein [Rahnella variigena]
MFTNPVINSVLKNEGGYVDHPNDTGGPTHWGITEKTARSYGYTGKMVDFTKEDAYLILEKNYWYQPGFDKVYAIAPVLALELCDTGTNMGPVVGIKWLQRWLNVFNQEEAHYADITVDGKIGPGTLKALSHFLEKRGTEGAGVLVISLNCSQGQRYLELAEGRTANESFVYGWMKGRINL